jgi:hypothetical protein
MRIPWRRTFMSAGPRSFAFGFAILALGCTPCSIQRIETQTLADATVGQSYTFEMEHNCSGGGGIFIPEKEEWRIDGDVPPGIAMGRDGKLHGVPSTAGTHIVRIEVAVSDFTGSYVRDARAFELRVLPRQTNARPAAGVVMRVAAAPQRRTGSCG